MSKETKRSILNHFFQIGQHMRQQHHAGGFGAQDLTMHQIRTLFFIQHEQPVRMSRLAEEFGITPGSATMLIDRLVESGWVIRGADLADRRTTFLELSPDAKQKLDHIANTRMEHASQMLDNLSADDLQNLDQILAKLEGSLKK